MEAACIHLISRKRPGLVALIDADVLSTPLSYQLANGEWVSLRIDQLKWRPHFKKRTTYAYTIISRNGRKHTIRMHRLILELPSELEGDHRDGDGLNNRSVNIRPATSQQNQCNQRKQAGTSSRFKGVVWHSGARKWMAQIKSFGKRRYLGLHATEIEAARAYDRAAIEYFGEFARLNFPNAQEVS